MTQEPAAGSPWPPLAPHWEALFPLRPARLALALSLSRPGAATLDAGCATGSLPRALAAQGRLAQGLDLEPAFLATARERASAEGLDLPWHEAGLLDLAGVGCGESYALVTCLGQTLPHLLEEDQWVAFFLQARTRLEPGGHLVVQVTNDGGLPVGHTRTLPLLETPVGTLERRRTLISEDLARFETLFRPLQGPPQASQVLHRRMTPRRAAQLLAKAGLMPGPAWADEGGTPFGEASSGWVLAAAAEARNPQP
jgi:SAM-dependent methyltransferase